MAGTSFFAITDLKKTKEQEPQFLQKAETLSMCFVNLSSSVPLSLRALYRWTLFNKPDAAVHPDTQYGGLQPPHGSVLKSLMDLARPRTLRVFKGLQLWDWWVWWK